jgi:hypothetical protein
VQASLVALVTDRVDPVLEQAAFLRSGPEYVRVGDEVSAFVDIQLRSDSTVERLVFTINLGVRSHRVDRFLRRRDPRHMSTYHWRARLGALQLPHVDWWATLDETTDVNSHVETVVGLFERDALPAIDGLSSDEALRDLWPTDRGPGLTKVQRLMYLSILVHDLGPRELLPTVIDELAQVAYGKPVAWTVERHVDLLLADL